MKRIAAPQVGGVFSAMILTLFVIPPIYVIWRWWKERRTPRVVPPSESSLTT
jgi:Cu(I)/Ag(I) efflux system membrane protein CusA/SilA